MPSPQKSHYLNLICHHITEKSGIGFDERKRKQVEEIVETRCQKLGLKHIHHYYTLLGTPPSHHGEFSTLMDILTIQESFFFRHKAQFHALRYFCLPGILDKKKMGNSRINIWSAGCANGEEAYSIAMLIRDLALDKPQMRFYIKGTDISRQALQKAREGVYTERAVRGLDPYYLDRNFTKRGGRYHLSPNIKTMVDFDYLNLSQEPFPTDAMPPWDIIFCRNVIIYFTQEHSRKLMKNFYGSMADGGFLFAGFSETMRYLNDDFVPIQMDDAFIYQKPLPGKRPKRPARPLARKPFFSTRATQRTTNGKLEIQSPKTPSLPTKTAKTAPTPLKGIPASTVKPLDERLSLARKLADKGETMEAVALLDSIIQQDPLQAQAHFMLAMIYRNAGNLDQSGHYLKKVIYLEPDNALARLHLADVFKETSRNTDAAREYNNVISLLENLENPVEAVFGDGFTGQAILTAARAHLKLIEKIPSPV